MGADDKVLRKMISDALSGKGAHVATKNAFDGLDWKLAGTQTEGVPSIFQLLNHVLYWNEWVVKWLAGKTPPVPKHAPGGWPGKTAPQNAAEWKQALKRFRQTVQVMARASQQTDLLAKDRSRTRLEMLQAIASHNSYHIGQVVLLRKQLGAWPPPAGGLTW